MVLPLNNKGIELTFTTYVLLTLSYSKGVVQLETGALLLSVFMAVFLLSYSFIEGIKIANSEEKVYGGTFILAVTGGFIFFGLSHVFI